MHLKAIEIAMKYLFSSQKYLSHLIISFNKNYKIYMETIVRNHNTVGLRKIYVESDVAIRSSNKNAHKGKI